MIQLPIPGIAYSIDETAVRVVSDAPLTVLSSAVVGAELHKTNHIVNMHVEKGYNGANPEDDLIAFAARLGIVEPFVGMMTAAWTHNARVAVESSDGITVAAIVTLGLSNLTAAGISAPMRVMPGTINTILLIDGALAPGALANAIITATEAKTLALLEDDQRTHEGHLGTGTSTDSVVVACTDRGETMRYAGPATLVGWLIARTVRNAIGGALAERRKAEKTSAGEQPTTFSTLK